MARDRGVANAGLRLGEVRQRPADRDGKEVGRVTSSVVAAFGAIALGHVRRGNQTPGTR